MRASTFVAVLAGLVTISLAVTACGDDSDEPGASAVSAVATTTHAGDLLRNVGGDRVEVHTLLDPQADPHGYEPRPSDVASIADAALVVRSGGDLDQWLEDLIDNAGGEAREITLIDSVRTIKGEHEDEAATDGEHSEERGEVDPHWWQDPRNAVLAVRAIEREVIDVDPQGRRTYERNADAYIKRLGRLDRSIAACMQKVPADKRKLVTTHDALGYFARRYDVEIVGAIIPSLSTQAQPSARDVNELVEQIQNEGVNAIFPETALNPKLESAISREANATVGDPLWGDALGPGGSDGETYLEAMASNTAAMVKGMTAGEVSCRPHV
jgi:ABC-type Zn uptake system ZnuABC Zn-binding protein ZnuA